MTKVLYAGVANLVQASSGTDLCSRGHLDELAADEQIALTAIVVPPTPFDPALSPPLPVHMFSADLVSPTHARTSPKLALLAQGGILYQTGFWSDAARAALKIRLAQRPGVLLIDHIAALANISLFQLLRTRLHGRTKIIVIAHDYSSKILLDRARLTASPLKRIAITLHAAHCHVYENAVYAIAHRVIFISSADRDGFRFVLRSKTDAICPVVELPPGLPAIEAGDDFGRYLIFVGSPSFFPNAMALDWIIRRFAPELLTRHPELKILLVGRGTERLDPNGSANVMGLGFVDDERLHRLLRASCGALSPVAHGSGIKIKVLEAIAAGCAVFATTQSLDGYDFMQLDPLLDLDDPAASAERVGAIVADPARLSIYRQAIAARWTNYKRDRNGRLAHIVKQVAQARAASILSQVE